MKVDDADIPTVRRLAEAKERRSSHRADCCKAIAPKLAKLGESESKWKKVAKQLLLRKLGHLYFLKVLCNPQNDLDAKK